MHKILKVLLSSLLLISVLTVSRAQNNNSANKKEQERAPQGKRALTVTDIMKFKQVESPSISRDGKWVTHTAAPDRGDPEVLVYSADRKTIYSISLAEKPVLSGNGRWLAAAQTIPAEEALRQGKAKEDGAKTGLYLLNTSNGAVDTFKNVQSFQFSNDSKWLIYHSFKDPVEVAGMDGTKKSEEKKGEGKVGEGKVGEGKKGPERKGPERKGPERKGLGTTLNLLSLENDSSTSFPFVTTYAIDSLSHYIAFVVSDTSREGNGIFSGDLSNPAGEPLTLYQDSAAWADNLSWNNRTGELAFLAGISGKKDIRMDAELFLWSPGDDKARSVLKDEDLTIGGNENPDPERKKNPGGKTEGDQAEEWKIYHTNRLTWTKDGKRLFLGIKPASEIILPEEDENGKDNEESEACHSMVNIFDAEEILSKREVDVWHWNDPYINSHQKKQWNREKDRVYTGVYFPEASKFVPLSDKVVPNLRISESTGSLLSYSNVPYAKKVTWDGRYTDYFLVDIHTGDRNMAIEAQQHSVSLSPDGKFLVWFSAGEWHMMDASTLKQGKLTSELDVPFADEDWDYPEDTPDYRIGGWLENSEAVLIYDKYDIWLFPTSGSDAVCLTEGLGRKEKFQFRIKNLDREKRYFEKGETVLLSAYHDTKKLTAIYSMRAGKPGVTKLIEEAKKYTLLAKAKDADKLLFTRQSYREFPDLWVSDTDLKKSEKLSDVNPQIAEFGWGDAELVEWSSADGKPLQGILIKPANYEPGKKYPVLVYYYRFFSNRLYDFNHVAINHRPCFPYYASNGYAIFLPDIRFDIGNPGYAATKCLVPGVQKIIDMGVADPDAVCLHGHSWSGYQTAFVITQTDMFACAIAGAPVSNMTSAYGGIRWESGLARQFQYENTQSRIGASLWEARDKYIENSPLFFADRINTPLLIQFGDEDGAVPWYQGIELYLAMRRLEKDCVFLQYRGEPHHLKKYANKLDYTLKFKAYMDHYLKGEPAPDWLEKGVPYKGK